MAEDPGNEMIDNLPAGAKKEEENHGKDEGCGIQGEKE